MTMTDCPNHAGNFDCNPFCPVCEGAQEIETASILCDACGKPIDRDGYEAYCYKCDPSFEYDKEN